MERWNPDEQQQRRKERKYWGWSVFFTVLTTGVVAVGTGCAFYALTASRDQVDIARKVYIATNRAWVDVNEAPLTVSLTWEGDKLTALLSAEATNQGEYPALEARLQAEIFIDREMLTIGSPWNHLCRFTTQVLQSYIFPKQKTDPAIFTEVLEASKVKNYMEVSQNRATIPISLLICEKYRIPGDDAVHTSERAYYLTHSTVTNGISIIEDIPIHVNLLAKDISSVKRPNSEYAD